MTQARLSSKSLAATSLTSLLGAAILAVAALAPSAALAEDAPKEAAADTAAAPQQAQPDDKQAQPDDQAQTFSVPVKVLHGGQGDKPMAGKPVILQAARPKGPFEPTDPKPQKEWTAVTDDTGTATFAGIPTSLEESGLRLHAVTTHGGVTFKSAPKVPAKGISLTVPVFEAGHSTDNVAIKDLQTIAHVWEDHVFFQQFYRLTVTGDRILDTATLPGKDFENGLPITLPTKALGINAQAPGKTKVVNSIVFWKGTLKPGETVPVSVTFSMKASDTDFVYEQTPDYPVENAKIVVPLESQSPQVKIPYYKDLALAAPGFEVTAQQGGGMQSRGAFLQADGRKLDAGESFAFKLTGLPFDQPWGAWVALLLGLAGAGFVFFYAYRHGQRVADSRESGELIDILNEERDDLLEELALLEEDWEAGEVSEVEYERESLLLRERIALVMKKIRDLEERAA